MTQVEFAEIMAYIAAAVQKPFAKESAMVYYDLLGDLDAEVMRVTARRVVLEHKYATFPTVAELREAASETMRGLVKELSPAEAWDIAWGAVRRVDLEVPHTVETYVNSLPPIVQEAVRAFGLPALVYGKEPVGVIRGQFLKIFEQLAARERREALLPESVKRDIAAIGRDGRLPGPAASIIGQIGREP